MDCCGFLEPIFNWIIKVASNPAGFLLGIYQIVKREIFAFFQYVSYNMTTVRRGIFNFVLGVLAVIVTVTFIMIVTSALSSLPIVFLRLAEQEQGEYDMLIQAEESLPGSTLDYNMIIQNIISGVGQSFYDRQYSYSTVRESLSGIVYADCSYKGKSLSMTTTNRLFLAPQLPLDQDLPKYQSFSASQYTALESSRVALKNETTSYWAYNGYPDLPHDASETKCWNTGDYCAAKFCAKSLSSVITAYSHDKEQSMGLGRNWDKPRLGRRECYISEVLARSLNTQEGDQIMILIKPGGYMFGPLRESGQMTDKTTGINTNMYVSYLVKGIFGDTKGKTESRTREMVMVDFDYFLQNIAEYLNPNWEAKKILLFAQANLYKYAQEVYFNLPPPRLIQYNKNDYVQIQNMVTKFAAQLFYYIGFDQIDTKFPILGYLRTARFISLFVGLIVNIIILILCVLSVILIYSLLMINVENRSFELGVLRMIGLNRFGLIELILLQAFFYAIPGWLIGMVLGQAGQNLTSLLLSYFFQAPLSKNITTDAFLLGTTLGIAIPVVASILPIMKALSYNIHDSLDTSHGKAKAVIVKITRAEDGKVSFNLLVLSFAVILFGGVIYYFLPLSLLGMNISLLLSIFFGILVAMLFGLVMLALNFQSVFESFFTFLIFFWENAAVRKMIVKNLVAHRMRNRKTAIMYSLSLGFIIFVAIAFNNQISEFSTQIQQEYGTRFNIIANKGNTFLSRQNVLANLDKICKTEKIVKGCGYCTHPIHDVTTWLLPQIMNVGMVASGTLNIVGISPNLLSISDDGLLSVSLSKTSPYGLDYQLYAKEGSGKMIIGETYRKSLSLKDGLKSHVVVQKKMVTSQYPKLHRQLLQPLAFLKAGPIGLFSYFPMLTKQTAFVSMPTYLKLTNYTVATIRDVQLKTYFVALKPGSTKKEVSSIKTKISAAIQGGDLKFYDYDDDISTIQLAMDVMQFFFIFTTIVAMVMCFFSLTSSMYTNINEQAKEIGVMRAIGASRFLLARAYVYEALILILCASFMGICIGFVMGYTMTLQSSLFSQLSTPLYVPWQLIIIIVALGVICSFLSTISPITKVLYTDITSTLRGL